MILAVASGKGGTGKTTVAVNLAQVAQSDVRLLDCDVEEPNAHLFFKGTVNEKEIVTIPVPAVDETLCDGCGACSRFCQYHAIVSLGTTPLVFTEMCHGCGGCALVCPKNAIHEQGHSIGTIETIQAEHITLIQGRLNIGVAMAPPLIRAVKKQAAYGALTIVDAPPGTSCSVISAIRGADFILLVTEPTPFGLHDLKLTVQLVREFDIPFGVIINRAGIGDERVHTFCDRESIPILMEIPDDRRIAEAYSNGIPFVNALPDYRERFQETLESLSKTTPLRTRSSKGVDA